MQTPAEAEFGPGAETYYDDGYTQQLPAPNAPPVPSEEVYTQEQAPPVEAPPSGQAPPTIEAAPTGTPATTQMSPEQMDQLMKEGSDAFGSADYEKAARLFLQVGMADAENVDAWLAYALARFASGDYAMSADAIRRGVMKYPDVVNSLFDLRERYGSQEDFQKHITRLQDFVVDSPSSPDGWLVLGFVRHFTGQREPAKQTFETLKERFESNAQIADIFLNAKTPAEIEAEIREAEERERQSGQPAPQSAPPAPPAPEATQ